MTRIESSVDYVRARDVIAPGRKPHEIVDVRKGAWLIAGPNGACIPGAPGWRGASTAGGHVPPGRGFRLISRGNAWDPAVWEIADE